MSKFQHVFTTLGSSNHAKDERHVNDLYTTPAIAVEELLKREKFNNVIWECACGMGHISKVLENNNYQVYSSDLNNYGYGDTGIDFLKTSHNWNGDIITNPPYKLATKFVIHALNIIEEGYKVAFLLRTLFLEGKERKQKIYDINPPRTVYVFSYRVACLKNNNEYENSSAMSYSWFIWEKGYRNETKIIWI